MFYSLDVIFKGGMGQICIKNSSQDKEGNVFVTPFCASISEIEEQVNRLKKELETIKKKAKKEFSKQKSEIRLFE